MVCAGGRASETTPTIALIVPTRNRLSFLRSRIPLWGQTNFDQVVIVNTPTDPEIASEIRSLCEHHGIRYQQTDAGFWDVRSKARNLGAVMANTDWIVFTDDDQAVLTGVDKAKFKEVSDGKDWLAGHRGDVVGIHRREAFLAFGGYPEDMVAAEDIIMSNRARRLGKGGPHGDIWQVTDFGDESTAEMPLDRARSYFWYSFTLPLFMYRTPELKATVVSDLLRALGFQWRFLRGSPRNLVYFLVYVCGRVASPVHLLWVLRRSGRAGFEREPFLASWAAARPEGGAQPDDSGP